MELDREDAQTLYDMMADFYSRNELSDGERRLFLKICSAFDFGRPVPHHGSGPDNQ